MTAYAELHALSNFTFLRGASHPEELVEAAAELGYTALAITDECSVSGVVKAHVAARNFSFKKFIIGSEFRLDTGLKLVALAQSRSGYARLCRLITDGRRAAEKGSYKLTPDAFTDGLPDCLLLWIPDRQLQLQAQDRWICDAFRERLWIAVELLADGLEHQRLDQLQSLGRTLDLPLVASGDVHMHRRSRRMLQDTITAIREKVTVDRAGFMLYPNGERYLRSPELVATIYPAELIQETLHIAGLIDFSLDEICYEYPHELVPDGETPTTFLRHLSEQGMRRRWPDGAPKKSWSS